MKEVRDATIKVKWEKAETKMGEFQNKKKEWNSIRNGMQKTKVEKDHTIWEKEPSYKELGKPVQVKGGQWCY